MPRRRDFALFIECKNGVLINYNLRENKHSFQGKQLPQKILRVVDVLPLSSEIPPVLLGIP